MNTTILLHPAAFGTLSNAFRWAWEMTGQGYDVKIPWMCVDEHIEVHLPVQTNANICRFPQRHNQYNGWDGDPPPKAA